jgi:hypothetical protein
MLIDGLLTTMYELLNNKIFVKLGFRKRTTQPTKILDTMATLCPGFVDTC